jgi:hypothetical protein
MKIRIKGNSVRYRLSRSEVDRLFKEGILNEVVEFDNAKFHYAILATKEKLLTASLTNNTIELFMPEDMINELATTERVGFKTEFGKLFLLVEKDFACIDQTDEDQSDNYPHPDPLKC